MFMGQWDKEKKKGVTGNLRAASYIVSADGHGLDDGYIWAR